LFIYWFAEQDAVTQVAVAVPLFWTVNPELHWVMVIGQFVAVVPGPVRLQLVAFDGEFVHAEHVVTPAADHWPLAHGGQFALDVPLLANERPAGTADAGTFIGHELEQAVLRPL